MRGRIEPRQERLAAQLDEKGPDGLRPAQVILKGSVDRTAAVTPGAGQTQRWTLSRSGTWGELRGASSTKISTESSVTTSGTWCCSSEWGYVAATFREAVWPTPTPTFTPTVTLTPTPTFTPTPTVPAGPPSGQIWRSYYREASPERSVGDFAGAQRIAVRVQGDPIPANNGVFYLLGDHLGSTSVVVDVSGNLVSELRYKAWGETRYASGTSPTDYRYTGQREEAGIGLYYYLARWYDPALARFTQADTIVAGTAPNAWDRYAYADNNPILLADPTGHTVLCSLACEEEGEKQWRPLWLYGVSMEGLTTLQQLAIIKAVKDVAKKLAETTDAADTDFDAFRSAFGTVDTPLTFRKVDSYVYDGRVWDRGAYTQDEDTVLIATLDYFRFQSNVNNIIHELGHVFKGVLGGAPARAVPGVFIRTRDTILHDNETDQWQLAVYQRYTGSEVFADMFVAWTYDIWGPALDEWFHQGQDAHEWMQANMSEWVP